MSFGFSVGDIITCYKLAAEIYDHCFTKAQGADVKYLQFGREISSLGESLKGLERIVHNAKGQRPQRPWHNDVDGFGAAALETLSEVTGDFERTLRDCETLLSDHSKFHRSSAGFVDNIVWWSGTEGAVNNLRERVHFHVTKVSLISKPFEIQLLLDIRRELQQLRIEFAELRGVVVQGINQSRDPTWTAPPPSFSIPKDIVTRFSAALDFNKPPSFQEISDWPLREGFDALVFHFAHSTVEFNPLPQLGQRTPEEPQYLNLLKSRWIMQKLKDSPRYQSAGSDSLWADYMRELDGDIRAQFRHFDTGHLVAPELSIVSRLPDECFTIWVVEVPSLPPPKLAEQRSLEDRILELSLPWSYGTRHETLTIFRVSDVDLRLVKTTKDEQNAFFHLEDSTELSMSSNRLIPIYANPAEKSINNNVLICNGQGQKPRSYPLRSYEDVQKFQQALTGYRVSHQMSKFSWCINASLAQGDSGEGILQFWHLKPLTKIVSVEDPASPEQSDSSVASPRSQERSELYGQTVSVLELQAAQREPGSLELNRLSRSMTQAGPANPTLQHFPTGFSSQTVRKASNISHLTRHSTGMSSATLVSRSSIASPVNGSQGEGTALLHPETPVLVIFTLSGDKHTFLHIPIDLGVKINPELCGCKKTKKPCTRAVIESKTKPFRVHKVSAEAGLYSWDLAQFRYPRRKAFREMKIVDKMKCVDLNFTSVTAKDEFIAEFRLMENLRNQDHNEYDKILREGKLQFHKPGKAAKR